MFFWYDISHFLVVNGVFISQDGLDNAMVTNNLNSQQLKTTTENKVYF